MSAEASSPSTIRTPTLSPAEVYVQQQLNATSKHVLVNDIAATLIGVLVWIFSVLLVGIIIDGWIIPLTSTMRWLVFSLLMAGILGLAAWRLFPVFFRRVNPKYTARMIESTREDFHNSIVNYTFVKDRPTPSSSYAVQAVSAKAAQDLANVAGHERVDRSLLIQLGLGLVGLVATLVIYSILSPKSPWPSVRRILVPSSDISRPSMVTIENVEPGDATIFFGQKLLVTASVRGKHKPESVILSFSTNDQRQTDVKQTMRPTENPGAYQFELSTSANGIDSSLVYHLEAGDGRTKDYTVEVRPNPTISVNEVTLTPPAYTKLPERILPSASDLSGVEGARVKVAASANLPIKVAYIELLSQEETGGENPNYKMIASVDMLESDRNAVGEFILYFDRKQNKPNFTHFQIKFISESGHRNEITNIYPIRIIPDLGPEVRIAKPKEKEIRVPVNQSSTIELVANDLDYEISSLKIYFDHKGTKLFDETFDLKKDEENQIVTGKLQFSPAKMRLKPGDEAIFFGEAADNRTSPYSQLPEPNIARTDNYLLIVDPPSDKPADTPPENATDQSPEKNSTPERPEENEKSSDANKNSDNKKDGSEKQNEDMKNDKGESNSTKNSEDSGESKQDSGSASEGNSSDKSEKAGRGQKSDEDEAANEKSGNEKGNSSGKSGKKGEEKADAAKSEEGDSQSDDASKADDQKGTTGNSKSDSKSPKGNSGDSAKSESGSEKSDAGADNEQRSNDLKDGDQQPLDDDATDSQRFESIKKLLEKKNANNKSAPNQTDDLDSQPDISNDKGESADSKDDAKSSDDSSSKSGKAGADSAKSSDQMNAEKNSSGGGQDSKSGNLENKDPSQIDNGKKGETKAGGADDQKKSDAANADNSKKAGNEKASGDDAGKDPKTSTEKAEESGNTKEDGNQTERQNENNEGSKSDSQKSDDAKNKGGESGNSDSQKKSDAGKSDNSKTNQGADASKGGSQQGTTEGATGSKGNEDTGGGSGGGNNPGGGNNQKSNGSPGVPNNLSQPPLNDTEQAELEYGKKVTDLVLRYLRDQEKKPDQELLDRMNWSEQDLKDFLKRWEQMAENAKSDEKAKKRWDHAIRGLGLRPSTAEQQNVRGNTKRMENLSEGSAVNRPPAELADEFNSFLKSLNRVGKSTNDKK